MKKKVFGASSEKSSEEILEQLSLLFNEPELQLSTESTEAAPVAGYTRKKRTGAVEEILPENVPVEVVEHRLPERELECPECSTLMTEIGKDVHRTLVMIPAQVSIREDWYFTYACQKCKQEGMSEKTFTEHYKKWCKRKGYHFSCGKAPDLYASSCGHFTTLPKNDNTKLLLTSAAGELTAAAEILATIRAELIRLAKLLPESETVHAIYGVGEITGAQ